MLRGALPPQHPRPWFIEKMRGVYLWSERLVRLICGSA